MAMRCRQYFVIYYETRDPETNAVFEKEHSKTRDKSESMKVLDSLLKAGVKARAVREYF